MPAKNSNKYGIEKGFLQQRYVNDGWTANDIAAHYGCTAVTVYHYMDRFEIDRKKSPKKGKVYGRLRTGHIDDSKVVSLYVNDMMSMDNIGLKFGCSGPSVALILKSKGINIRGSNDTKRGKTNHLRKDIDTCKAKNLYAEGECMSEIGRRLEVSSQTVRRALIESDVEIKTLSETLKGKRGGKNNANYRPWLTVEDRGSRRDSYKANAWRSAVFDRDGYSCLSCGDSKGGNLNAHHILPYSIAKNKRWDVENGATLCNKCHRAFHRQYGLNTFGKRELTEFIEARREQIANLSG